MPEEISGRMSRQVPCIRVDDGTVTIDIDEVIEEISQALFVNGRHAMTSMMSPRGMEDFVTGYLFTEQIIKSVDEIESIRIDENRVSVITKNSFTVLGPKKTILSGCGGAVSYIDTEKLPVVRSDFTITLERIRFLVREVLDSELHTTTGGIHMVGLCSKDGLIARSEDIGRHNALDRVIGHGLRNRIDLSSTFVVCSGRISSEMVRKCVVCGIPVLVSRGATTTLAITVGEKTGVCIVAFVRSARMIVYSHPERIEGVTDKLQ